MLLLESFQAGLSWDCILNKRDNFREAFDFFDVHKVSSYKEEKIEELMQNTGIVRNRRKIQASIRNAQVFIDIQKEFGSFDSYIWSFTKGRVIVRNRSEILSRSPLSDEISKDLKSRGMSFVGSVIIYSYLQAIGVVSDHDLTCDFRKK